MTPYRQIQILSRSILQFHVHNYYALHFSVNVHVVREYVTPVVIRKVTINDCAFSCGKIKFTDYPDQSLQKMSQKVTAKHQIDGSLPGT